MESDILVSVIITTYRRSMFLSKALDSVYNQSYKNLEIIVVDDNAGIPEVRSEVKAIVAGYDGCILLENKTNLGGSLSRNEGVKAASGHLLSFLDDDDTYVSERISKCVAVYKKHKREKVGLIYTYCNSVNWRGEVIGEYRTKLTSNPLFQHMCSCICATSQWVVPANVFKEIGMFEDSPCKQDSIMLVKILGEGFIVLNVPENLSNYTEHEKGRISGCSLRNIQGLENFRLWCRKYYDNLSCDQIKIVESKFDKQLLYNYMKLGMRKESLSLFVTIRNKLTIKEHSLTLLNILLGRFYNQLVEIKKYLIRYIN